MPGPIAPEPPLTGDEPDPGPTPGPTLGSARDPAVIARFRRDLASIVGQTPVDRQCFGVAFSGGPDSLALLLLAHHALSGRVRAVCYDHALRPESADETRHAAMVCQMLGIPQMTLTNTQAITGNKQATARKLRYAAIEAWREASGLDWVMTGHHADDQLETFVMRINRGSGVNGLASIRRRNGTVLRPLLDWRRAELGEIVALSGLDAVDDPSNRDNRYDRARLRSVLAGADWLDPLAAARSVAHIADTVDALDWMTSRALARACSHDDDGWLLRYNFEPRALWHRMLVGALERAQPDIVVGEQQFYRLWAAMLEERAASIGTLLVTAHDHDPQCWRIAPAPPRKPTLRTRLRTAPDDER